VSLWGQAVEAIVRRVGHAPAVPSDFKTEKPISDKAGCARKVLEEGACRACGGTNLPLNRAHVVPASQGGPFVPANIIPLGGSGSIGCHGIQTSHHRSENCRGQVWTYEELVERIELTDEEVAHAVRLKGFAWVSQRYPSATWKATLHA
jgi:hypothetical protein